MKECDYCNESAEYTTLVQKPKFFIHDDRVHQLVNVFRETNDLICIDCLQFEVNELKECF